MFSCRAGEISEVESSSWSSRQQVQFSPSVSSNVQPFIMPIPGVLKNSSCLCMCLYVHGTSKLMHAHRSKLLKIQFKIFLWIMRWPSMESYYSPFWRKRNKFSILEGTRLKVLLRSAKRQRKKYRYEHKSLLWLMWKEAVKWGWTD